MSKKSSSTRKQKYPKIVNENKALCKAVSLLPTSPSMTLPAQYARALPMVLGVVTAIVLIIIPFTRNNFLDFSKKTLNNFVYKTEILQDNLALSLRAGISAYVSQIENNIKILPTDSDLESKNYLGRIETKNLKQIKTNTFAEKAHFITANIYQGFDYLKK